MTTTKLRLLLAATALASLAGCVRGPPKVPGLDDAVRAQPDAWVEGRIIRLEQRAVLEDRDFVYGIGLSPTSDRAVHTRLAGKTSNGMLWTLEGEKPALVADFALNDYEFDVEGVDFAPDGSAFVTAGRDGAVRAFSGKDAKLLAEWYGDEKLVSVAFTADGRHLVAGGEKGLLALLRWPGLQFVSETRAHTDEVRSVAAVADGRMVTGSWDKSVAVLAIEPRPLSRREVQVSVRFTPEPDRVMVVGAALDGRGGLFALDLSREVVVVTRAMAKAAGIEPGLLAESVMVGPHEARLARGRTVTLKHLSVEGVDVAVCDPCVPKNAQGVLGGPVLSLFDVLQPVGGTTLVFTRKDAGGSEEAPLIPTLVEERRHRFDAFVNDVSVDRAGARLGVAFSHDKSERNRQVYEREKRKEPAAESPDDHPAIVELESGKVVAKWPGHHRGVVSTAGISPDGRSVASGGWDNRLFVFAEGVDQPVAKDKYGWILRRIRFSRDGRRLAVAAWTPQNAVGDNRSDPSAVVYEVAYGEARLRTAAPRAAPPVEPSDGSSDAPPAQ